MDKFPQKYDPPKLNQEAESLNRPITAGEIEEAIKKSHHTKVRDQSVSEESFTKHLRKS